MRAGRTTVRLIAATLLVGAIAAAVIMRERLNLDAVVTFVDGLGVWGGVAFVSLFAAAAVLFLPGAVFGLAGGALFGPLWGTALNVIGGTIGATLAFLAARYLAADWAARRAGGRLKELVQGVESEGWRFVALVRLVPIFPFNLSNYALGLTRIPLGQYVAATLVCMIPGSAAYAWLGHAGRRATEGDQNAIWYGLLGLAALAVIAFLARLVIRLLGKRNGVDRWIEPAQLSEDLQDSSRLAVIDVREPDEFEGALGHIAGARNIPVGGIVADPHQYASLGDRLVVLVCRTDRRSAGAAEALISAGFREVVVLRGGMERWNALGLSVERPGAPVKTRE